MPAANTHRNPASGQSDPSRLLALRPAGTATAATLCSVLSVPLHRGVRWLPGFAVLSLQKAAKPSRNPCR